MSGRRAARRGARQAAAEDPEVVAEPDVRRNRLQTLKDQREALRSVFKKSADEMSALLVLEEKDKVKIQQAFSLVNRNMEKLRITDQKVEDAMLQKGNSQAEFEDEYNAVNVYNVLFDELHQTIQDIFQQKDDTSSTRNKTSFRLPKIEWKKFSGDPKEWLYFWSQFRPIHEDDDMTQEEKFHYLHQATMENSRARGVVDSFPPTSENYPKVIEYLRRRFGREEVLVEVYVRELLGLVLSNQRSQASSVTQLYDKLETQLRSLESLGVTEDKYAAMLYPLVESCLPEEVLKTWERSRKEDEDNCLKSLMLFMRKEVDGEERVKMAKSGFGKAEEVKSSKSENKKKAVSTAVDLYSGAATEKKCIFCEKPHESTDCFQAQNMKLDEKKKIVGEKGACYVCLRTGHISKKCKTKIKCAVCGRRHPVLMCPDLPANSNSVKGDKEKKEEKTEKNTSLSNHSSEKVLLQTLVVVLCNGQEKRRVRAILDTGSQRSYITKRAAEVLKLKPKSTVKMTHGLFGGVETKEVHHCVYDVQLQDIEEKFTFTTEIMDQDKICGYVTRSGNGAWRHEFLLEAAGIFLSDHGADTPDIHILLGADVAGQLFTGNIYPTLTGPTAMETRLGWTVMGKTGTGGERETSLSTLSLLKTDVSMENLWRLDVIGVRDEIEMKTEQEKTDLVLKNFEETITVDAEGRYEVALPWINGHPPVADNFEAAKKRLQCATRKLNKEGMVGVYTKVFEDWEKLGIIERVPEPEWNSCKLGINERVPEPEWNTCRSFLPHRPVFNLKSKTTPIRPVFDASARSKEKPSLNDCLEKGPNLIELVPAVITRFRRKRIGLSADIEKAFLQIGVKEEDRNYLCFLWWEEDAKTYRIYRHKRVVFGVSSSPFLLAATLDHHLRQLENVNEEMVQQLRKSLYVDNCLPSVDSVEDARTFIQQSTDMMKKGKFNLRDWVWNENLDPDLENEKKISVLGLVWNVNKDTLSVDTSELPTAEEDKVTKRKILSVAHRIFDPIGFTCPVTILPRLLLQDLWSQKIGWDEAVPEETARKFNAWSNGLQDISKVEVPRWIMTEKEEDCDLSLHVFTDASKDAYGACVFLRSESSEGVTVQLLLAKSRVAPKGSTIPRLELLGCLVGARLLKNVKEYLEMDCVKTYLWTDSSNALYWIINQDNWLPFVCNQVEKIRRLTAVKDWRHVSGVNNPADLPSRGCNVKQLLESHWWEGPEWLKKPEDEWPSSPINCDLEIVFAEKKKSTTCNLRQDVQKWYKGKYTDLRRIVRVIGWMLRWKKLKTVRGDLTAEEEMKAELTLWRLVQDEAFINNGVYKQLHAGKDKFGVRRVKSKIVYREDTEDFRFPILLPHNHEMVHLLIIREHNKMKHMGVNAMVSHLREKYWIVKTRQTVKKVLAKCIRCQRHRMKKMQVEESALPVDRVRDAEVFEVVGVDLGGPLYLEDKKKIWFAVFTCAVYRAVHLELVTSLSTGEFMKALRRFIARRGRPAVIMSDNGTNFEGLGNMLKKVDWKKVENSAECEGIVWKFIPPSAPWWGGFWERVVRMVKDLLKKNIGRGTFSYEDLGTLLCDIESIINCRPLNYVSEDFEDPIPLTPMKMMTGVRSAGVPDLDHLDSTSVKVGHKKLVEQMKELRSRFRSEYLGKLKKSHVAEENRMLKVGDLVFIGCDQQKRTFWPIGVIEELLPSQDGVLRRAKVRTRNGILTRALQRLYPLEFVI